MTKRFTLVATTIALAAAVAVPADGAVTVYKNNFSSKADYAAVTKQAGKKKKCKRNWRKKSALGVSTKGGKQNCALKSPVEADSVRADLTVTVDAKVTEATQKATRKGAYVGVSVRSNRKEGYVLRVFPKTRKWELLKNRVVVKKGDDKAVKGMKKRNKLEVSARGDTIAGKVNGKRLVSYKDPAPDEVEGYGTGVVYGISRKVKKKEAVAFFDKLKVGVPNP
jgi:hypothetical protein